MQASWYSVLEHEVNKIPYSKQFNTDKFHNKKKKKKKESDLITGSRYVGFGGAEGLFP